MSAFSQLIASVGKPQAPAPNSQSTQRPTPTQPPRTTSGLVANNAAAGVKRRSEEQDSAPRPKSAKTEHTNAPARPAAAPSGRFQLTAKGSASTKAAGLPNRPSPKPTTSANPQKSSAKPVHRPGTATAGSSSSPAPAANANGAPAKRGGFASILAKAQAAQEAAKAAGTTSGIKHKPVTKLTRRERERMMEQQKAQQQAAAKGGKAAAVGSKTADRSRSGTPNAGGPQQKKKAAEPLSYKGTMRKPEREPLSYKGTMRAHDPAAQAQLKKKKQQQHGSKYDGYVSWSDLDDAEDEEEEGYDSESDMEGGFDDVEAEEMAALRSAKKEDQEALAEEERLRREKAERKRKLELLSRSAAASKKRF